MDIKTKFSNGDKVFFMKNNNVNKGEIKRVKVVVSFLSNSQYEHYEIIGEESDFESNLLFKTKEGLLKSL